MNSTDNATTCSCTLPRTCRNCNRPIALSLSESVLLETTVKQKLTRFLKETLENMEEQKRSRALLYFKKIFRDSESDKMVKEDDISIILTSILDGYEHYLVQYIKGFHHEKLPAEIIDCVKFLEQRGEFTNPIPSIPCTEDHHPAVYSPNVLQPASSLRYDGGQYIGRVDEDI